MKLLIVTQVIDTEHPILGFFHRWVIEFAKHCDEVTVLAGSVGTYSLPENVSILSLGKDEGKGSLTRVSRLLKFSYTERNKYDVVFVHMIPEFVLVAGILWKLLNKKVGLWYVHGSVSLRLKLASLLVNTIFTTSKESCKLKTLKVHTMNHGIDVEAVAFDAEKRIGESVHLLSASRISPVKKIDVLLEVFALLKEKDVSFGGVVVGGPSGPRDEVYANEIKKRSGELGVVYTGPVPHTRVFDELSKADMFLSAAENGSVDKAVLEAAASGALPIFTNKAFADALDAPELQVSGSVESFSSKIIELLHTPAEYQRLRKKVRTVVEEKHSLKNLVPAILKHFL